MATCRNGVTAISADEECVLEALGSAAAQARGLCVELHGSAVGPLGGPGCRPGAGLGGGGWLCAAAGPAGRTCGCGAETSTKPKSRPKTVPEWAQVSTPTPLPALGLDGDWLEAGAQGQNL